MRDVTYLGHMRGRGPTWALPSGVRWYAVHGALHALDRRGSGVLSDNSLCTRLPRFAVPLVRPGGLCHRVHSALRTCAHLSEPVNAPILGEI